MKLALRTLVASFLPLVFFGRFAQGGLWVLNFQTANNWMAGYIGDVTVCLHFQAPNATARNFTKVEQATSNSSTALSPQKSFAKEDCQNLPSRSFQRGQLYTFAVEYAEDLSLDKARVFTKQLENSVCNGKSVDTWHLDQVSFQSMATGMLFDAIAPGNGTLKPMLVHSKCGGRNEELLLDAFNTSVLRRPCVVDGVIYKDGDRFELGCSSYCKCKDSAYWCTSMCPPSFSEECRQIYVPGQCCQSFICEKKKPVTCPLYESSDCETANRTVDPGEFPWAAFIKLCTKSGCHRFCSGVLLSERWVLTAAECLFWGADQHPVKPEQMRVIVGEHTLILDEDGEVEIPVTNITLLLGGNKGKSSHFGLVRLKDPVVFDREVQPAILPLSRDHCLRLVQPSCALSLTGWIHVGTPDAQQYDLYKLSTQIENPSSCAGSTTTTASAFNSSRKHRPPPPPPSARRENICLNLANDDPIFQPECDTCQVDANSSDACFADKTAYLCTGERGRALVSKVQVNDMEVNYLVGITSYRLRIDETPKGLCKMQAYELAINICHDLHRITDVIN